MAKGTTTSRVRQGASPRSGRAAPLAPAERRAAIIEATIPLLREHGLALTTRRIAEAAAVAEGTIFSVFPDKETLIAAAVDAAMDPAAAIERLHGIDLSLPLVTRTGEAVAALQEHFAEIWRLLAAVGPSGPRRVPVRNQAFDRFGGALEELLSPDAGSMVLSPTDAARTLLGLALGCSHPVVVEEPMPAETIAKLFLSGVEGRSR